jgi:hypothetical protein
MYTIR